MNPLRTLLVSVALLFAVHASAQPAIYTDLGLHTTAGSFNQNVTLTAASNVQWFRIVLPAAASTDGYVDIWNSPSGLADNITDSESVSSARREVSSCPMTRTVRASIPLFPLVEPTRRGQRRYFPARRSASSSMVGTEDSPGGFTGSGSVTST